MDISGVGGISERFFVPFPIGLSIIFGVADI